MSADRSLVLPSTREIVGLVGHGFWELLDEHGELLERGEFTNIITQVGDQYYSERAAGIASPPAQVTGMQLGTGATALAKTGAGAAIVTYIAGSAKAIDGGFPVSIAPGAAGGHASARRIQWKTSWAAGEATNAAISEVVLINQAVATNAAAAAANTISRALFSPTIPKGANDTLAVIWNHDSLGA